MTSQECADRRNSRMKRARAVFSAIPGDFKATIQTASDIRQRPLPVGNICLIWERSRAKLCPVANAMTRERALARQPQQERARARCERVLGEARKLLIERGLAEFSIPDLAERLDCSRAAIYNFFPTPYAIFNELTQRYLGELESTLYRKASQLGGATWQDGAQEMASQAAKFYNRNPVARILMLGGPTSNESFVAQSLLIQRLGSLVERLFAERGVSLPKSPPNVCLLTVEIGTACYRVSYFLHGRITAEYEREAGRAMVAYVSTYVGR